MQLRPRRTLYERLQLFFVSIMYAENVLQGVFRPISLSDRNSGLLELRGISIYVSHLHRFNMPFTNTSSALVCHSQLSRRPVKHTRQIYNKGLHVLQSDTQHVTALLRTKFATSPLRPNSPSYNNKPNPPARLLATMTREFYKTTTNGRTILRVITSSSRKLKGALLPADDLDRVYSSIAAAITGGRYWDRSDLSTVIAAPTSRAVKIAHDVHATLLIVEFEFGHLGQLGRIKITSAATARNADAEGGEMNKVVPLDSCWVGEEFIGGKPTAHAPPFVAGQKVMFTTLPAEIRQLIYEHYLVPHGGQSLAIRPVRAESFDLHNNLLRASRGIRCEALPTFYGGNVFVVELEKMWDRGRFVRFLEMLGEGNIGLLRRVRMVADEGSQVVDFEVSGAGREVEVWGEGVADDGLVSGVLVGVEEAVVGLDVLAMEMMEASSGEGGGLGKRAWVRLFDEVAVRLGVRWYY